MRQKISTLEKDYVKAQKVKYAQVFQLSDFMRSRPYFAAGLCFNVWPCKCAVCALFLLFILMGSE